MPGFVSGSFHGLCPVSELVRKFTAGLLSHANKIQFEFLHFSWLWTRECSYIIAVCPFVFLGRIHKTSHLLPAPAPAQMLVVLRPLCLWQQGRVNPLQTTFKTCSSGLGAGSKLRPRVTHFPSHVPSQALNAPDGKSDAIRAQEKLDRRRGGGGKIRKNDRRRRYNEGGSGKRRGNVQQGDATGAIDSSNSRIPSNGVVGDATGGVANVGGGFWGQGTHSTEPSSEGTCSMNRGSGSNARRAGAETGRFASRKDSKAREQEEKRKDRRTRFELFSDVPEEFAALFEGD